MKFERSEIGALFSKLRTAVPEVRAVGNDSTGILLSGPDAFATNLELSIRAELSSPVPQGVVIPPRGVDFISGAVAPEININVTKSGLVIESGTARARLSTTPAENYPTFDGPGKDAKLGHLKGSIRCVQGGSASGAQRAVLFPQRRRYFGNLRPGWVQNGHQPNRLHRRWRFQVCASGGNGKGD